MSANYICRINAHEANEKDYGKKCEETRFRANRKIDIYRIIHSFLLGF